MKLMRLSSKFTLTGKKSLEDSARLLFFCFISNVRSNYMRSFAMNGKCNHMKAYIYRTLLFLRKQEISALFPFPQSLHELGSNSNIETKFKMENGLVEVMRLSFSKLLSIMVFFSPIIS